MGPVVSVDGGANWNTEPVSPGSPDLAGSAFYALAVDPADPDHVVAATRQGLYRREPTTGGGFHWDRKNLPSAGSGWVTTVVATHSGVTTTFYAATWFGPAYSSTDGVNWSPVGNGFPTIDVGRIGLAVRPTANDAVYALIHDSSDGSVLGVWRLDLADNTWRQVTGHPPDLFGTPPGQGSYDLAVAVDPNNANRIYLGGSIRFSGGDWSAALFRCMVTGSGTGPSLSYGMTPTYIGNSVHADVHALVFAPGDSDKLWVGCDGGVFYSTNPAGNGDIFQARNTGLATLTMNHLGQHPTEDAVLFCGTQDNGGVRYTGEEAWLYSSGGDGGFAVVNWNDPYRVLSSYVRGGIRRSTDGGSRYSYTNVSVPLSGDRVLFYAPLVGTPPNPANPAEAGRVAFGSNRPWISDVFGGNWRSLPDDNAGDFLGNDNGSRIRSLALASHSRLYAGTMDGRVYRYDEVGGNWTRTQVDTLGGANQLPIAGLPVTDIAVDPADAAGGSVYITFGGSGDFRHVWRFNGTQWQARSGPAAGNVNSLLDVHHNAIAVDPANPNDVYVGADIGVWNSTDGGTNWGPFSLGLPDAAVMDLKLHNAQPLLRASTHGRGVFEHTLDNSPTPGVDLYVRDTQLDLGRRPTVDFLPDPTQPGQIVRHWAGPDIKLDTPDFGGQYQFPLTSGIDFLEFVDTLIDDSAGVATHATATITTRVHVQVHNRGVTPADSVRVMLLLANTSASLPALPAGFDASVRNGVPINTPDWQTVGVRTLDNVRVGFPKIAAFDLTSDKLPRPVNLPGNNQHTVLALTHQANDPFTSTETQIDILSTQDRKTARKDVVVVEFTGTVPAPVINPGGMINAVLDSNIAAASARSLISIFGSGLADSTAVAQTSPSGQLPTTLAGAQVRIGGVPAPLLFVSPQQINAQVPDISAGTVPVTVITTFGGSSAAQNLAVTVVSPGIFVITKANLSIVSPSNPASPGDVLVLWTTGLGQASPHVPAGQLAPSGPLSHIVATPAVAIGGVAAAVVSTVLSPDFVGLEQVAVTVPQGVPVGAVDVVLTTSGLSSNTIQIPVQ